MTDEEDLAFRWLQTMGDAVGVDDLTPKSTSRQRWEKLSPDEQVDVVRIFRIARTWFRENAP